MSDEQVARYRRFRDEVTVGGLEQFFRLDAKARAVVSDKRRPATMLGWAVQWGTVRILGTFRADTPPRVPAEVAGFAAEQAEVDPACAPDYLARPKTAYEHSSEIRDLLGLPEFSDREQDVPGVHRGAGVGLDRGTPRVVRPGGGGPAGARDLAACRDHDADPAGQCGASGRADSGRARRGAAGPAAGAGRPAGLGAGAAPKVDQVEAVAAKYAADWPAWGHRKIAAMMRADGYAVSTSTVERALRRGRVLSAWSRTWSGVRRWGTSESPSGSGSPSCPGP